MVSEMRVPYISRDQRSRPCTSVPSRKSVLVGVAPALHADEVPVRRDQPRKRYSKPWAKNRTGIFSLRIGAVHALEGQRVARALDAVDVGREPPVVEPVDALGRHERALRLRGVGVGVGEEVRADHDQVEGGDDERARHRHLVLAEAPPHELPLRGDEDALLRRRAGLTRGSARGIEGHVGLGHHASSRRMRGSIHTSRMSEISVPITVMTPSSSTMVPGQEHVLGDEGLQQQRPDRRQSEHERHDDAPGHDVRQRVADGAREGVERDAHRVLQDHAWTRTGPSSAPSPRRACAARRAGWRA